MRLPMYAAAVVLVAASLSARADTVTFVLDNADQTAVTLGDPVLYFDATISAPLTNTGDIYLNSLLVGDDFSVHSDFADFPSFLVPGQSVTGLLFAIVTVRTAPGTYNETATLAGGSDPNDEDLLGGDPFSVTVVPAAVTTVTPEPSGMILLGTGLLGVAGVVKRRFVAASPVLPADSPLT